MKRICVLLGMAAVASLITFLAVTRFDALHRARNLELALKRAEARLEALESEREMLRSGSLRTAQSHLHSPLPLATQPVAVPSEDHRQLVEETRSAHSADRTDAPQPWSGQAQAYRPVAGSSNWVVICGNSTLGEWRVQSALIGGSARFSSGFPENFGAFPGRQVPVAEVMAYTPVKSLVSVKNDGSLHNPRLEGRLQQALRGSEFAQVKFELDTLSERPRTNTTHEVYAYDATGYLIVAGATNRIRLPVEVTRERDAVLRFAGEAALRMSDYGIAPPTETLAGFVIRAEDDIRLSFNWRVRPSQLGSTP